MTDISLYTSNEFSRLEHDWKVLQNGNDMTAFQNYEWYKLINNQYIKGCFSPFEKAVYILAKRDNEPVMIAPVHLKKYGIEFKGNGAGAGAYIIGEWGFTDYLNFIYDSFDGEAFESIINYIRKELKAKKIFFRQIPDSTELSEYLQSKHSESLTGKSCCVSVSRQENYDVYLKSLRKSVRQNLRTAVNRAQKDGVDLHIEIKNQLSVEEADEFFNIYLKRSEIKNRIANDSSIKEKIVAYLNQQYNKKLKKRLYRYNYIKEGLTSDINNFIICIYSGERKIGFIYGFEEKGDIIRIMIVCFDEEYSWYSPGMFALNEAIKKLYETEKFAFVDLTRGTEKYKYDLGGTEHYITNFVI